MAAISGKALVYLYSQFARWGKYKRLNGFLLFML